MGTLRRLGTTTRQYNAAVGAFVLGMGVPAALMAARSTQWSGSWGATGQAFSQSSIFLLPAVAAWATWCAAADGRRSMRELVAGTERGRAGAAVHVGRQVLLGATLGAIAALAVSLLVTADRGAAAWVAPLAALPVFGGLCIVVVLAVLAGTAFSSIAVPPALLALVYLAQSAAAYQGGPFADALSVAEFRSLTHAQLYFVPVLARTLLWSAAASAVALTALNLHKRASAPARGATWRARGLSLVVCSLASTIVLFTAGSDLHENASSLAPICRTGLVTVCVTTAHRSSLNTTAEWVESSLAPLHGLLPKHLVVVESGLGPVSASQATRVEVSFVDAGGRLVQQPQRPPLQAQVLETVLHAGCPADAAGVPSGPAQADETNDVHRWLLRRLHVPTDGSVMPGAAPLDMMPHNVLPPSVEHELHGVSSTPARLERLRRGLPCLITGAAGSSG